MAGQAKIDEKFSDRIKNLEAHAEAMGVALTNSEAPEWFLGRLSSQINPADPASIPPETFGRDKLDEQFDQVTGTDQPGTVGDLAAIQLQGDFMASLERAVRSRYLTPYVRTFAHAGARQQAAGDPLGPLRRNTMDHVEDILKRGSS